jgi:NAD(P)-dependent dehydrogenase (short-subunit alcohol dehydrogenase family)
LEPYGVGVSVLCPGYVPTRLVETTVKAGGLDASAELSSASIRPLDAAVVGRLVVDGIQADRPIIVTHGEYRRAVEARHNAVTAAFDGVRPSTAY